MSPLAVWAATVASPALSSKTGLDVHAEQGDVPRLEVQIVGAVSEATDPPLAVPKSWLVERNELDGHQYLTVR